MMAIWIINIVFGILNSIIAFSNENYSAGMGWACSAMGWLVVLINKM